MTSPRLVLFFDRDVGIVLPQILRLMDLPTDVEVHQDHFPHYENDDVWMPTVGARGWTLIGHDSQHHRRPSELSAIRDYQMGCFYLPGRNAVKWQKVRYFLNAYEKIVEVATTEPRPFIYRIDNRGALIKVL